MWKFWLSGSNFDNLQIQFLSSVHFHTLLQLVNYFILEKELCELEVKTGWLLNNMMMQMHNLILNNWWMVRTDLKYKHMIFNLMNWIILPILRFNRMMNQVILFVYLLDMLVHLLSGTLFLFLLFLGIFYKYFYVGCVLHSHALTTEVYTS